MPSNLNVTIIKRQTAGSRKTVNEEKDGDDHSKDVVLEIKGLLDKGCVEL